MLKIKKVNYDSDFSYGCATCNFGSSYISNIEFIFEDGTILKIETDQMYDYTLTESDFMKIVNNSDNLDDFYKNMFETIKNKSYDIESRVGLQNMIMKINGKKIDIVKSCRSNCLVKKGRG